ncbi:MAG: NUDIX hydrolase [Rhodobacteraceae bacterium]|nr:NUDIX hydrolase [Paracoccaceae bacterium]
MDFSGAKLALFIGADLVVIRRDDKPDIPYPGHWDLPGGGREGDESPVDCALRETHEELGLLLSPSDLVWSMSYLRPVRGMVWFFVAHMPAALAQDIRLGQEGQEWRLMSAEDYMSDALAVPHFAQRLRDYLDPEGPAAGGFRKIA